jgi:FAD-dependent urate hydroxylase
MLLEAFGTEHVHLGRLCVEVEQDDHSATAIFANGERVSGDLVIGADGIHSAVRAHVVGHRVDRRYARYVNWNGLVKADPELCEKDLWVLYVGDNKRASMMPVGGDRFYFFFGAPMAEGTQVDPSDRRDELANIFQGWPTPVQKLIQAIDPAQTNRLEIGDIDPLERLVQGRIALLGDSAHATTPTLGQGGCQAMEDAEVITTTWSPPTSRDRCPQALRDSPQRPHRRTDAQGPQAHQHHLRPCARGTQQWYTPDLKQEPPEAVITPWLR